MKSADFIDAVYKAGWRASLDAQHTQLYELWRQLFPTAARLEDEIEDLMLEMKEIQVRNES